MTVDSIFTDKQTIKNDINEETPIFTKPPDKYYD